MGIFNIGEYGLVLRIVRGYLTATSPEFGITLTKRFDDIKTAEQVGSLYFDMFQKITEEIKRRQKNQISTPQPKKPLDLVPKGDPLTLSVKDVACALEVSEDTVRRLVTDRKLKCTLTRGGHRRFRAADVYEYIEKSTAPPLPTFIKSAPPEIDQ